MAVPIIAGAGRVAIGAARALGASRTGAAARVALRRAFPVYRLLARRQARRITGEAMTAARMQLRRDLQIRETRIVWHGDEVLRNINAGMGMRVKVAAQLLRDRVVRNISRPVTKVRGASGRTRVDPASRSKPGEFPKADTTRLMKDVFWEMRGTTNAIVGTTLDYGLILETRMDRSFLVRTLNEQRGALQRVLAGGGGPRLPGQR